MEEKNYGISIKEIFNMIVHKFLIIALVAVLFAGIAGVYTFASSKDVYSVNMKYYVKKDAYDQQSTSDISYAINVIPSIKEAYSSGVFHEKIAKELHKRNPSYANVSSSAVGAMISFVQNTTANAPTYTIVISSTNAKLAQEIANIVHDFTVEVINSENYTEIQNLVAGQSFNITFYNEPSNPYLSISVKTETVKSIIIGFLTGAMISTLAVVICGVLDPTIRDKNKLAREVDAPILGVIPRF